MGGLPDVVEDTKTGYLVGHKSPEKLAKVISTLTRQKSKDMRKYIKEYKTKYSWAELAETIVKTV